LDRGLLRDAYLAGSLSEDLASHWAGVEAGAEDVVPVAEREAALVVEEWPFHGVPVDSERQPAGRSVL